MLRWFWTELVLCLLVLTTTSRALAYPCVGSGGMCGRPDPITGEVLPKEDEEACERDASIQCLVTLPFDEIQNARSLKLDTPAKQYVVKEGEYLKLEVTLANIGNSPVHIERPVGKLDGNKQWHISFWCRLEALPTAEGAVDLEPHTTKIISLPFRVLPEPRPHKPVTTRTCRIRYKTRTISSGLPVWVQSGEFDLALLPRDGITIDSSGAPPDGAR
jgi:hypothetical protein